jgi:hypothetical protein
MNKRDILQKALEDLVVMAMKSGFDVDFRDIPENTVVGLFHQKDKRITVDIGPKAGLEDILFITAHEVRHMQHYQEGIYRDYYRDEHEDSIDWFNKTDKLPISYVPPNPCVGIRAEADCNKWAKAFMKSRGITYEPEKYKIRNVMGYAAWIRYQALKRERDQKAPRNKGAAC